MINFLKNRIVAGFFAIFIVSVLSLAPFSPSFQYQNIALQLKTVEAGGGSCVSATGGPCAGEATAVGNWATNAGNAASNAANSVSNAASAVSNSLTAWATNILGLKEVTLDGIAWGIINIILQEMIRSITAWVNAGFPDGGPAFVQDLGGFLKNIADGLVGDFILGSPLGFMCSPFQLDVQIALSAQYLFGRDAIDPDKLGYEAQCRMSDVINNINEFTVNINGGVELDMGLAYDSSSFAAGGWAWVLEATNDQENNVFGAQASAQAGLSAVLSNSAGEEIKLLEFGEGFLSSKDENGNIVTPGSVIEAQLNKALFGGQERLTVADEINELIAALFAALAREVMSGIGGLFGMSFQPFNMGGDSYDSYLDALAEGAGGNVGLSYDNLGESDINEAESYITALDRVIGLATTSRTSLANARADFGASAITATSIPQSLIDAEADAILEKANTLVQIADLETLRTDYNNASSSATGSTTATTTASSVEIQIDILNDVIELQADMPGALEAANINTLINNILTPDLVIFYATLETDIQAAGGDPTLYIPAEFQ